MQSSTLATMLGVTQRTVANLAKQGMPHSGELYEPALCVQWYIRHKAIEAKPTNEFQAKARKLSAEAESAELDLLERRGELIPREVHETRTEEFAARLFASITGSVTPLVRKEFPDVAVVELQMRAERIGDGLIKACRDSAELIDDGTAAVEAAENARAAS